MGERDELKNNVRKDYRFSVFKPRKELYFLTEAPLELVFLQKKDILHFKLRHFPT